MQPSEVNIDAYDAGLLSDFGGGEVGWWQDYIRAELGRAHDHYVAQIATEPGTVKPLAWEQLYPEHTSFPKEWHGTGILRSRYVIKQRWPDGGFFVLGEEHGSLGSAQAAAQAHYAACIHSAIPPMLPTEMEVWVAIGDDHDYDAMSQWLIGVYGSEAEAKAAGEEDAKRYVREGGKKDRHNVSLTQTTIRLANDRGCATK